MHLDVQKDFTHVIRLYHDRNCQKESFAGSGLLIGHQHVLTCEHVAEQLDSRSHGAPWYARDIDETIVEVQNSRGPFRPGKDFERNPSLIDLAVFRLSDTDIQGNQRKQRDQYATVIRDVPQQYWDSIPAHSLWVLGGPDLVPGRPGTIHYASARNIQVAGGIEPGYSGGPVVMKRENQWVCVGIAWYGGIPAATSRILTGHTVHRFIIENVPELLGSTEEHRPELIDHASVHFVDLSLEPLSMGAQNQIALHKEAKTTNLTFKTYLESVVATYKSWWQVYTPIDATRTVPVDFGLLVIPVPRDKGKKPPKPVPVLEALIGDIRENTQVLLTGGPGSGKSTALVRLLLELSILQLRTDEGLIPVLIELRYWKTTLLERIKAFLQKHDPLLPIDDNSVIQLLRQRMFLLIFDGINELPSDEARITLSTFRYDHPNVPMAFSTRDIGQAESLGIRHVLRLTPLTDSQMNAFIVSYSHDQAPAIMSELKTHNLISFCRTPLLLWMLCNVFIRRPDYHIDSLAAIFRRFVELYEESSLRSNEVSQLKGDVSPLSDRRLWRPALQQLASRMMNGQTAVDLELTLPRPIAETVLQNHFRTEKHASRDIVDDLLKYHMLEKASPNELEFHHQLIQEYYAAETLVSVVQGMEDTDVKSTYLNYLKWTEPFKMVLTLLHSEEDRQRILRLAYDVDPFLGEKFYDVIHPPSQEKSSKLAQDRVGRSVPDRSSDPLPAELNLDTLLENAVKAASLVDDGAHNGVASNSAKLATLMTEIETLIASLRNVKNPSTHDIARLRASIERLGQFDDAIVSKELVNIVMSGVHIAKRCAAIILLGVEQEYRRYEGSDRTPQEIFLRDSKNRRDLHSLPFQWIGWLALLTDRHVDIIADAVTLWERFPAADVIPPLITLLLDGRIYHDHGEDRRKEYISGRANECLSKALQKCGGEEVYLRLYRQLLPHASRVGGFYESSSFEKLHGRIADIQAKCLFYDYEIYCQAMTRNA